LTSSIFDASGGDPAVDSINQSLVSQGDILLGFGTTKNIQQVLGNHEESISPVCRQRKHIFVMG